jgi:hypothetical protein
VVEVKVKVEVKVGVDNLAGFWYHQAILDHLIARVLFRPTTRSTHLKYTQLIIPQVAQSEQCQPINKPTNQPPKRYQ